MKQPRFQDAIVIPEMRKLLKKCLLLDFLTNLGLVQWAGHCDRLCRFEETFGEKHRQ